MAGGHAVSEFETPGGTPAFSFARVEERNCDEPQFRNARLGLVRAQNLGLFVLFVRLRLIFTDLKRYGKIPFMLEGILSLKKIASAY
ncbi:MAG: hypothetical protein GY892_16865 [Shimia sp.]|nr:hypothetical protein [Shimia sp.]